ncbi:four helix bundle protein [Candidatus Villigracilis affinis]|uniref:four helix bundle protein n=1 Tax=Candidatus Villigracilis affinis TaxID=3140682 RepID=UPI0031E74168
MRPGTVGANCEGHRANPTEIATNCVYKMDETDYWLDLLVRSGILSAQKAEALIKETNELIAIFTTIVTKIKKRMGKI